VHVDGCAEALVLAAIAPPPLRSDIPAPNGGALDVINIVDDGAPDQASWLAAAGSGLWVWALISALLGLTAYPVMALHIARRRAADRGDLAAHARLYGALTMLAKIPELRGAIRYARARARGERGAIIEYKAPADGTKDAS
jgi:hypothetical protein